MRSYERVRDQPGDLEMVHNEVMSPLSGATSSSLSSSSSSSSLEAAAAAAVAVAVAVADGSDFDSEELMVESKLPTTNSLGDAT